MKRTLTNEEKKIISDEIRQFLSASEIRHAGSLELRQPVLTQNASEYSFTPLALLRMALDSGRRVSVRDEFDEFLVLQS